jgi:hypothetical protein
MSELREPNTLGQVAEIKELGWHGPQKPYRFKFL